MSVWKLFDKRRHLTLERKSGAVALLDEIDTAFRRFMKAYCVWARETEANFLSAMMFGGIGAITIVLTIVHECSFSPYYRSVDLEYLTYVMGILTGIMGGRIFYLVQKYRKNHHDL